MKDVCSTILTETTKRQEVVMFGSQATIKASRFESIYLAKVNEMGKEELRWQNLT